MVVGGKLYNIWQQRALFRVRASRGGRLSFPMQRFPCAPLRRGCGSVAIEGGASLSHFTSKGLNIFWITLYGVWERLERRIFPR